MSHSPTIEGFRIAFTRPLLGLAEISWRWIFGAAASALLFFSFIEYLDTLPVTSTDQFLLGTQHPTLVGRALAHILHGSGARFVAATIVLGLTLSVGWIVMASWGRAVTLKGLLAYFHSGESGGETSVRMRSLAGLNFLRVGATLAVAVASFGAIILGGMASPEKNPSPGMAFLVFLLVMTLAWSAWSAVNWFLSLAAVFVVSRGEDTFSALGSTADICRSRFGKVMAVSSWFGLAHLAGFMAANFALGFPLAFAALLPRVVILGGVGLVLLIYFALADWLYMGRLAAYMWIIERPEPEIVPSVRIPPVAPAAPLQPQNRVDQDELILGDLPVS